MKNPNRSVYSSSQPFHLRHLLHALCLRVICFFALLGFGLAANAALTLNGTGVYSFDGSTVGVEYNSLIDPTTGANAANYAVTGTTVSSVTVQADSQSVVLHLGSVITGQFVVTINNVKDSTLANTIAANTKGTNSVLGLTSADFQTTEGQPFSTTYAGNVATIVAGGSDIWVNGDFFIYNYLTVTNDFDFRLRVQSVSDADGSGFSRSGLMARDALQDGGNNSAGHQVLVAVNEANTYQVILRPNSGAAGTTQSLPPNPLPIASGSNSWVRLQRQGNIFTTYSSSNGLSWTQIVQFDGSVIGDATFTNSVLFLGIATGSHTTTNTTTAVDSDMSPTPTVPVGIASDLPTTAVWRAGAANSLTIGATGNPIFYQWRSNAVDVVGQTNATYTDLITHTNDGATYSVRVYNAISTNLSGNCVVTVSSDTNKPTIFGAYSYDGLTVGVDFLKAMNPATTTNIANYNVTGASITSATLASDAQSVFLTLSAPLSGQFVVTVNNVQDVSQNVILAGSKATNAVLNLTLADVNSITPGFSATYTGNWATIVAGGADIFGTSDNLVYSYLIATNNFDYQLRVRKLVSPDSQAFSRSGIMARESITDPGSKEMGEFVNWGNGITNTFQTLRRIGAGATTLSTGGTGTPATPGNAFPNLWVRLRRDNTVLRAYWSTNTPPTTSWVLQQTYDMTNDTDLQLFSLNEDGVTTNQVYLGIATSAHSGTQLLTATDADFGAAPEMPVTITTQPANNTVVNQSNAVTITVAASGIPISYQWRTNGTAIPGATNTSYTIPAAGAADGTWAYSVLVYNDISSQISSNAFLTVLLDTNTPAITGISSYDGTTVTVYFSEKLDPTTAANPANYTVPGATVTGATLLADGQSVLLTLSTVISGGFTVTASNVQDLIGHNVMVAGSQAFNTVYNTPGYFSLQDYNTGTPGANSATFSGGMLTTVSGGADIFGTSDNCYLVYIAVTNNFDYRMRAQSVANISQAFARVGLMVRDSTTAANARMVAMVYNNGQNAGVGTFQLLRRTTVGGGVGTTGANPGTAFGTNSWLRVQRIGNVFTCYTSTDGDNWTLYGTTPTIAMTSVAYLGIVTSAHAANPTTVSAVTSDFGITPLAQPTVAVNNDGSGHVVLTWPGTYPGYQLLSSPSLTAPVWTTNTAAPAIVSGQFNVTLTPSGSAKYFRLSMPQF